MFDNEGHWIDDPLDVVNAKPDFSGLGMEPKHKHKGTMTEVFTLTLEREARDWGQISFEVIGVFPNFDKALDHLKDIKNKEDELSDLSPHAIDISEKTANWWYRDWDGIYDYKIESVKYYEQ